jgi:hypothetical protein
MDSYSSTSVRHLFLLGQDYHLGDLLWFTAVLAAYRRNVGLAPIVVGCPDRAISRILEHNPLIDELLYGAGPDILTRVRSRSPQGMIIHDLRILPIAVSLVRQWGYRVPWLYYRDLWLEPRGQWLATYLRVGRLPTTRPVLCLTDEDRVAARQFMETLPSPYIVLAPHIGQYTLPLAGVLWRHIKGWPEDHWRDLADLLRRDGFTPVTMAAAGEAPIPGTTPAIGLPIRQAAAMIEQAAALISVESGLWYIAAALARPLVVVPWWLPHSVDWLAPMGIPYRLIPRRHAAVWHVHAQVLTLVAHGSP